MSSSNVFFNALLVYRNCTWLNSILQNICFFLVTYATNTAGKLCAVVNGYRFYPTDSNFKYWKCTFGSMKHKCKARFVTVGGPSTNGENLVITKMKLKHCHPPSAFILHNGMILKGWGKIISIASRMCKDLYYLEVAYSIFYANW